MVLIIRPRPNDILSMLAYTIVAYKNTTVFLLSLQ